MQQKLLPIKNVSLSQYYPARNYSTSIDQSLFICQFRQPDDNYRALLQFDLSKFESSDEIQRAYLLLNIYRNEINSGVIHIGIYRLLQPWDENIITWDDQVPFASTPEYHFAIPAAWFGFILFDITRLTCSWIDHIYLNHGFILVGEEHQNSLVAFHSLRNNDSSCWPMLIVT